MGTNLNHLFIIFVMYKILAILHNSPGICCSAQNVSAFFIFGDSLVDVGNNYFLNTIAMPTFPNGIDFVNGTPSGRYTNGRTVADIIEEDLDFQNFTPAYLNPNTTGDVVLRGVNFASSGSGILNSTGLVFGAAISMDEQINNFAKTRQYIISRIGVPAAQALLTQALYLVAIGSNDIFSGETSPSHDSYLDNLISEFKSQLTALYNLDARKIIVTNAPMVGCTPFERDLHSSGEACVDFLNELAKLYNSRLKSLLPELTTNLAGSTFVYVDSYAMSEEILQNYKSYGFENAEFACCQVVGQHGGLVPCGTFSRVCPDRTKYVFWDPFHPTESANLIMAKIVLDGDLNYVSPMNIRQLVNS